MRLPKRGERGFTLIELLIVVAILGVLAAVVIPNVQRFIGAGTTESEKTELADIQVAVSAMMVDNEIGALTASWITANLAETATNQMGLVTDPDTGAVTDGFPAPKAVCGDGGKETDPEGGTYTATTDKDGYILYQHDITGGDGVPPVDGAAALVNYVAQPTTAYWYWVDTSGTVHQETTKPGT